MATKWSLVVFKARRNTSEDSDDSSDESITDEQYARSDRYLTILKQWLIANTQNKTSLEKRQFFYNVFLTSPGTYLFCRERLALPFPPVEVLKEYEVNFEPRFSEDLMQHLSRRLTQMPDNTKYVNLCIDNVGLNPNISYDIQTDKIIGFQDIDGNRSSDIASEAFLVILNSCFNSYWQPLGYAFTEHGKGYSELSEWIDKLIRSLYSCGFVVCAVVSSGYNDLAKYKGVTIERPYFEVDDMKIFYIFDAQILLMNIRDTMIETNLFYDDDNLISWSDVVDVQMQHHVLSKAHVSPNPDQKRTWLLASHVFEDVVADYIAAKYEPDLSGTAQFIATMKRLCEILIDCETNLAIEPIFIRSREQLEVFESAAAMFRSIKLPEPSVENQFDNIDMSCFTNIQITMNAISQMHEYFAPKGLKKFLLRKFSRKPFNSLACDIVTMSKENRPTAKTFQRVFSKLMSSSLLYYSGAHECDEDLETCIQNGSFVILFKDIIQ